MTTDLQGFKTVDSDVTLAIGDRFRLGLKLEIGSVEEHVTVTAQTPLLQTETAAVAVLVDERAMQDLPLNGRNFVRLAQIAPGAHEGPPNSLSSGNRPDDRRQSSSISINGQDTSLNNFLIDGLDNNERFIGTVIIRPSVDAIQEMRVETNSFSAELGRAAGGVINVVTKSGTNQLHGSAFEFYRNEAFDARNFFAATGPKPEFKLHQFGGSLGGRIIADKSFFFVDYAGLRLRQGNTYTSTVPTLGMCRGDFSGIATIYRSADAAHCSRTIKSRREEWSRGGRLTILFPVPVKRAREQLHEQPDQNAERRQLRHLSRPSTRQQHRAVRPVSYNKTTTVLPAFSASESTARLWVDLETPSSLAPRSRSRRRRKVNFDDVLPSSVVLEAKGGFSRYDAGTLTSNYGLNVSQQMGIPGLMWMVTSTVPGSPVSRSRG